MAGHSTKPISLTDQQLVHTLRQSGYTYQEIADIVGIAFVTVRKILKKPLSDIEQGIACVEYFSSDVQDDGCYRTYCYEDPEGNYQLSQQRYDNFSDPTFDQVAQWEEEGED